jgi:hypothetical protein
MMTYKWFVRKQVVTNFISLSFMHESKFWARAEYCKYCVRLLIFLASCSRIKFTTPTPTMGIFVSLEPCGFKRLALHVSHTILKRLALRVKLG